MYWSGDSIFLHILLALCLTGCAPEKSVEFETDLVSTTSILDSIFIQKGEDSLRAVQKTITVNGVRPETQQIRQYNIKNDLDILKSYDLATARWADFVETDERDSAGLTLVTYTTTNDKAPVKKMHLVKYGHQIQSIQIHSLKKSIISEQTVDINWKLNQGYTLKNISKLLFRKPGYFKLEVHYQTINTVVPQK